MSVFRVTEFGSQCMNQEDSCSGNCTDIARFEVVTSVLLKIEALWAVTPCQLLYIDQHFKRIVVHSSSRSSSHRRVML